MTSKYLKYVMTIPYTLPNVICMCKLEVTQREIVFLVVMDHCPISRSDVNDSFFKDN